jgi:hypothetical protein
MKLKVFMWQVFHDRLQTGEELKKRNWRGDEKCLVCGVVETRDHILSDGKIHLDMLQGCIGVGQAS